MRVNYYFRNPGKGNYSLENVFDAVIKAMSSDHIIDSFYTQKPIDFYAIFEVRKLKADIHHITGAVNYLAFGLPGRRTVITVHDTGHYSETLKGWRKIIYKFLFWVFPLKKAKAITTISTFTKEQLIKHFGISSDKITVIPNPANPNFKFTPCRGNAIAVILQIGAGHNKNIEILIEAAKGLKVKLLLIRPPDTSLAELLQSAHIAFEFRYNLSENELIQAYADSDIVYFASTYEGFGLPILEGMAIGRPVITSNISPMKDVALENALLVDPNDKGSVRQAILALTSDEGLYKTYQQLGLKHIELYRVDKIAKLYDDLYKSLLAE